MSEQDDTGTTLAEIDPSAELDWVKELEGVRRHELTLAQAEYTRLSRSDNSADSYRAELSAERVARAVAELAQIQMSRKLEAAQKTHDANVVEDVRQHERHSDAVEQQVLRYGEAVDLAHKAVEELTPQALFERRTELLIRRWSQARTGSREQRVLDRLIQERLFDGLFVDGKPALQSVRA